MIVRTLAVAFVFAAISLAPAVAQAQWLDANGNPVMNPGDSTPLQPLVVLNWRTGLLTIDTRGLNFIVDTTSGTMIGGDDIGFISMVVEGPEPGQFLLTGLQGTGGVGTNWTGTYFNGKAQYFGTAVTKQFLMPIGVTPIAQYDPFSSLEEAISRFPSPVELGVNFAAGQQGATIFGPVAFSLPSEPTSFGLVFVA